jgi:hypothetical protein
VLAGGCMTRALVLSAMLFALPASAGLGGLLAKLG